jgi:hypothetical protein
MLADGKRTLKIRYASYDCVMKSSGSWGIAPTSGNAITVFNYDTKYTTCKRCSILHMDVAFNNLIRSISIETSSGTG